MSHAYSTGRAVWLMIRNKPYTVQKEYSNPYAIGTEEWKEWEQGFQNA